MARGVYLLYGVSDVECVPSVVRALRYRVPVSVVLPRRGCDSV